MRNSTRTLLAVAMMALTVHTADAAVSKPDFSHPATVLSKARASLQSAGRSSDSFAADMSRNRALLEIITATRYIDPDSVATLYPTVDSVAALITTPSMKAVAYTIKADFLVGLYNRFRYKYDRYTLTGDSIPTDPRMWGGNTYRRCISAAADSALSTAMTPAGNIPLSKLSQIVTADRLALRYFPGLADFTALKARSVYSSIGMSDKAEAIASRMVTFSRDGSAPWAYWVGETYPADRIFELYLDNKSNAEAPYLLQKWLSATDDRTDKPQRVRLIREALALHPSYWDNAGLTNTLRSLEQKTVDLSFKSLVYPNVPSEISVRAFNTSRAEIDIYRLPDGTTEFNPAKASAYRRAGTLSISDSASVAGRKSRTDYIFTEPGRYALVPRIAGVKQQNPDVQTTLCTPIIATLAEDDRHGYITVTDLMTGRPVEGVEVLEVSKGKTTRSLGSTDSKGLARINKPSGRYELQFRHNGKVYDFGSRMRFYNTSSEDRYSRTLTNSNVMTDRSLYHHGDTLRWALVTYTATTDGSGQRHTAADKQLTVKVFDPNGRQIDSTVVTTDALGRANGMTRLPDGGVSGSCLINVSGHDHQTGYSMVTVSDFKLPTFRIDSLQASRRAGGHGIEISGMATTFAGMPVSDADVSIDIYTSSRWWRSRNLMTATVSGSTDGNGRFVISVADSAFTRDRTDDYLASATVTDAAGSAATAQTLFTNGKPYQISITDMQPSDTDRPVVLPVKVADMAGRPADIALRWALYTDDSEGKQRLIKSGTVDNSPQPTADMSDVPSGEYTLTISAADTALARPATVYNAAFYNLRLNTMPSKRAIFIPVADVTTAPDGTSTVTVGCPHDSTWVYMMQPSRKSDPAPELMLLRRGFNNLPVRMADGDNSSYIRLWTTRNVQTDEAQINLTRPDTTAIVIKAESFRDKITANTTETWRFTIADKSGRPQNGAGMAATMFNASLLSLNPYRMDMQFMSYAYTPQIYLHTINGYNRSSSVAQTVRMMKGSRYLTLPCFFTDLATGYGQYNTVTTVMARSFNSAAVQIRGTKSQMSAKMMTADSAVQTEEEAVEDAAESPAQASAGGTAASEKAADTDSYRPSEVLQALWAPRLTADSLGNVELSFNVPDANTTWAFRAVAWTERTASASLSRDVMANKPVMVTPALPRFMRQGDRGRLVATVFNNSDKKARIKATVEIFDPSDGKVTHTESHSLDLEPMASATVGTDVTAAFDASAIGYRVRATDGHFSDGEQQLIPVLESSMTVTDITPFYLPAGEGDYSLTIDKGRYSSTTLEYTANPVWEVVKALPALSGGGTVSATGAATTYYGAMITKGLAEHYPALSAVIRDWESQRGDSSLVSRLAQQRDMKGLALDATPWVQAAESESRRMADMAMMFDTDAVDKSIAQAAERIKRLQNSDGGIMWTEGAGSSSVWATERVLLTMARLNALGYGGNDSRMANICRKAFDYLCRHEASRRHPSWATIAYLHAMMPQLQLTATAAQGSGRYVQSLIRDWKNQPTAEKARTAYILAREGFGQTARTVMQSVDEFAVATPNRGTSFPSVGNIDRYIDIFMAYNATGNNPDITDGMRRWLIIRAQATERLGAADATALVTAILDNGGSRWLTTALPDIRLGKRSVTADKLQQATGHIVAALPDASGKTLTISRKEPTGPSYGAVISVRRADMDSIRASWIDDLRVEKRIDSPAGGIRLGDKVKVTITVTAKRDMDYVTLTDERSAALAPLNQMPGMIESGGLWMYRDVRDARTNLFISHLPKGTYHIEYEAIASMAGSFASGCATATSDLDPSLTARSGSRRLTVVEP